MTIGDRKYDSPWAPESNLVHVTTTLPSGPAATSSLSLKKFVALLNATMFGHPR